MVSRGRRVAACLALLLPAVAGCEKEPAGACPAVAVTDGSQPLFQNECGGTATASGTAPVRDFSAAKVFADYHCGGIEVTLFDAGGYTSLTISFPYSQGALGHRSALFVFSGSPHDNALVQATGTVMLTAISDPLPTASGSGTVEGTFSVESGCLSLVGSFASPYCAYDDLCG